MKHTRLSLLLFVILAMIAIFAGSAAAQDIDVNTMSNEELMVLLQSIMQKLDQDTVSNTEKNEPETAETPVPASTDVTPTEQQNTDEETKKFSIYENKKLIIGRMPDSWFIRRNPGNEDEGSDNDGNNGGHDGGGFHYGGEEYYPVYGGVFTPPNVWILW